MAQKDKLACSVCGAYSRSPTALCAPRPAGPPCPAPGTEAGAAPDADARTVPDAGAAPETPSSTLRVRSRHPSLEMLFCTPVGYEARFSCSHCGRLATAPDLLCLPKERGG